MTRKTFVLGMCGCVIAYLVIPAPPPPPVQAYASWPAPVVVEVAPDVGIASPAVDASAGEGSVVVSEPSPPPPPPPVVERQPNDRTLAALRMCESTNNYAVTVIYGTNTPSIYSGAYQFDQPTWNGVAARHIDRLVGVKPSAASPADQDQMARHLWWERGDRPWPTCGPKSWRA